MSDYFYGADLTANPYLARISTSSPRKAVAVLEAERRRFEEMRMWCYDIPQQDPPTGGLGIPRDCLQVGD